MDAPSLQPALLDLPPIQQPIIERGMSYRERFEAFHALNPHVFRLLRHLALDMKRAGARRWSIWSAANVLRWKYAVQTTGDSFRINHNHLAFYSRMLMETTPELSGFFETRDMKNG